MTIFIIRPLHPDEQLATAQLFHDVWHETQSQLQDPRRGKFRDLRFFQNRIATRARRTLVASREGHLQGFGSWTGSRFDSLFVTGEARGCGLGSALLQAVEGAMADAGARRFMLDCLVGNDAGRRFYERHGWHVAGEKFWEDETPDGPAWARSWVMVKSR